MGKGCELEDGYIRSVERMHCHEEENHAHGESQNEESSRQSKAHIFIVVIQRHWKTQQWW